MVWLRQSRGEGTSRHASTHAGQGTSILQIGLSMVLRIIQGRLGLQICYYWISEGFCFHHMDTLDTIMAYVELLMQSHDSNISTRMQRSSCHQRQY